MRMAKLGDVAFNSVLKAINACLRSQGFKRIGQSFSRQSADCWQVISAQKSVYSSAEEKSFTINFGICPKAVLDFSRRESQKTPLYYTCPIRFRINRFLEGCTDKWWPVSDAASADAAIADVTSILKMNAIPFLDGLLTNDQILELYSSGSVLGFEIDRDEAQLVLAAQSGQLSEVEDLLQRYEQRWLTSGAHKRASDFCNRFCDIYGQPRECSTQ
jgi:hypothetical protein